MINRRGFTLVELVIVIAIIGILTAITVLGLGRYQQTGRDNIRTANVTTVANALEKYYDQKGEYPSCAAVTASGQAVTSTTLNGLDPSALLVPNAASGTTNSIQCGATLTINGPDFFQYVGDGSADCSGSNSCLNYTLRYKNEVSGQILELKSRRTTNIATSGAITNLAARPNGFTVMNLTWSTIQNSTSYTVQQATDTLFTTNLTTTTVSSAGTSFSGLTPGTQYFYRVMPQGGGQTGAWSNTAQATTLHLGTPAITATTVSTSQITVNWNAVANADGSTTYTLQRASDNAFTTNLVTVTGLTGTSYNATGLTVGQTYYFRLQAIATGDTSSWSNTASSVTTPNAPTGVTATVNSATQITVAWTASPGATGYTIGYGTTSAANSYTTTTTGTSVPIGALSQGTTWYFIVYATAGGSQSAGSSVVNGTTPINAPGAYSMSGWNNGSAAFGSSPVSCPSGTTPDYYWNANGGFWVQGTGYSSVGYSLSPGQGVTIQVATRCIKGSVVSSWTWSSNSYSYTRPGMNLSLSLGADECVGGYCGRVVNANWNNMCGTGAPTIYAHELSAYSNWVADSSTSDSIHWKGASSPGVWVYYDSVNIGCTSGSAAIQVQSVYLCTGCS